jgi:hypothetical protein
MNEKYVEEIVNVFMNNSAFICEKNEIEPQEVASLEDEASQLDKEINKLKMMRDWKLHQVYEKRKDAICAWVSKENLINDEALFKVICEYRKSKYVNKRFPF